MTDEPAVAVAARIDEGRLWQRHMDMARCGATAKGGVNRQALSAADGEARVLIVGWARECGYEVATDAIGNLFIRRPGTDPDAAPVLGGSHLDSQPTGGRFDGAYGVLAAFETLQALDAAGIETRRPVEVVSWLNEEGSRFQPGTMGALLFSGLASLEDILPLTDSEGVTVRDALKDYLATTPGLPQRPFGFPVAAYVEPHIEQGPILEEAGESVAVVDGVQGLRWFGIEILGEAAHAGTTPRALRRDAMRAANAMLARLYGVASDEADLLRFTVGRFEVSPGSPNTVPERVYFTIDLRHPEAASIERMTGEIEAAARDLAGPCTATVTRLANSEPTVFDAGVIATLEHWRGRLGLSGRRLTSGAGHDAMHIAKVCPSAMIFVPCEKGISHHESENAKPEDLAAGARLLAASLADLATR
jgi:beta-ureidopropionase / N-carbamoyl-L-amino-acid hydrolase